VCSVPPVATAVRGVLASSVGDGTLRTPRCGQCAIHYTARAPGRRGAGPQSRAAPSPCRAAAPAAPHLRLAPSVAAPTATPAARASGGDGTFTRVRGLAKAPLPTEERTPRVSRRNSCATGISVIAESREPQAPEPECVLCRSCSAGDATLRCLGENPASPAGVRVRRGCGTTLRTLVTAFGRLRRQAGRGFCRELRQLRQYGAWPGRRCQPRRRAAARPREAPLAAAVRLGGGTAADPAGPRPETAVAPAASLPSHRSHKSLQAIGPREVTLVAAGEPPVTSGVRFTCN
jgi:hypothetical protein